MERKTEFTTLRMTPEFKAKVQAEAEAAGMSVSRYCELKIAEPSLAPRLVNALEDIAEDVGTTWPALRDALLIEGIARIESARAALDGEHGTVNEETAAAIAAAATPGGLDILTIAREIEQGTDVRTILRRLY